MDRGIRRRGTPVPVLERWNAEFTAALSAPKVQKVLLAAGLQAAPTSLAYAQKFHREEVVKWGEVIRLRTSRCNEARRTLRDFRVSRKAAA
jgi:tripartite-type tricarboxylate transporter receptor subunit TctC